MSLGLDLEVEGRVVNLVVLELVGPVRGPGLHVGAGGGRGPGAVTRDCEGRGQEAEEGEREGHGEDRGERGTGEWRQQSGGVIYRALRYVVFRIKSLLCSLSCSS